jgi:hypothetical protein
MLLTILENLAIGIGTLCFSGFAAGVIYARYFIQ